MKEFQRSIFLFRRDLRLEDNSGLLEALERSEEVIPVFIFDERQIDPKQNKYFGEKSFQFMCESLHELEADIDKRGGKLQFFKGSYQEILKNILAGADAVFVNKDYTPFSRARDKEVETVCASEGVQFFRVHDYALSSLETIVTGQGNTYSIFTPFMKKAAQEKVPEPRKNNFSNYSNQTLEGSIPLTTLYTPSDTTIQGGREAALRLMRDDAFLRSYKKLRDVPSLKGTSRLSPHLKFGTVSIREVYEWGKTSQTFISELYWRDFYLYIAYHFPKVFGEAFQEKRNNIPWINNEAQFEAWKRGETGVPIVDAGMRQLNELGWMHNRVRMIVASFLTKNLLIDWRWGEEYFATKLVDYDPSSNNGGWQWSASVGADPKPLRIFNPYTQTQKYDPEALYIKEWVPELASVETELLVDGKEHDFSEYVSSYPKPLVSQKESYHRAREAFSTRK